jgi:hypothetical protein
MTAASQDQSSAAGRWRPILHKLRLGHLIGFIVPVMGVLAFVKRAT